VVSVWVEHDKIPHTVWLVGRLNFYDGSVFLYLLAIIVDLIAEDKGRPSPDRPLMKPVGAQMQARVPVADPGIGTELEVLSKPKNLLIILERVIEIAHFEHWADPLRFHDQRNARMPNGFGQEFQPKRQGVTAIPKG
jgi:hypothetical protein